VQAGERSSEQENGGLTNRSWQRRVHSCWLGQGGGRHSGDSTSAAELSHPTTSGREAGEDEEEARRGGAEGERAGKDETRGAGKVATTGTTTETAARTTTETAARTTTETAARARASQSQTTGGGASQDTASRAG